MGSLSKTADWQDDSGYKEMGESKGGAEVGPVSLVFPLYLSLSSGGGLRGIRRRSVMRNYGETRDCFF